MSGVRGPMWRRLVLPVMVLTISVAGLLRSPGGVAEALPLWRGMIASLLPIVLGALVVAAVAAGMVIWRRERRGDA